MVLLFAAGGVACDDPMRWASAPLRPGVAVQFDLVEPIKGGADRAQGQTLDLEGSKKISSCASGTGRLNRDTSKNSTRLTPTPTSTASIP
jgi:hypothetical protein